MTIAEQITRIKTNIANAFAALKEKGATIPDNQVSDNLVTTIESVTGGGSTINNQDKTVTTNGTVTADDGYTGLGTVTVNVSTTAPEVYIPLEITSEGVLQKPAASFTFSTGSATSIGKHELEYIFQNCTGLTSVDLSSVTSIGEGGLYNAFAGCTNLTSASLSKVTSIDSKGLSDTFTGCTSLTSIYFRTLTTNSFGSNTDQFNNMLSGVTGCTVHFPAALESTLSSWSDVKNGFGGTNTTVLFDITASAWDVKEQGDNTQGSL